MHNPAVCMLGLWTIADQENAARHLARATRMRQPPEKVLVARPCAAVSKDRPARMALARASAVYASISSSRWYTCLGAMQQGSDREQTSAVCADLGGSKVEMLAISPVTVQRLPDHSESGADAAKTAP